jgi:hypothetical protein
MKIEQVTLKRRTATTIADDKMHLAAWGALKVVVLIAGTDTKSEVHVEMSKEELVEALKKITDREEEIAPKRFKLSDEFCDGERPIEHMSHYDYLKQTVVNGQPSAYKEHIKKINNDGLIRLLKIIEVNIFIAYTEDEIHSRMAGK